MNTIVTLYSIGITIGAYCIARIVGRKYPSPFTTPVFFSTTVIISILLMSHVSYTDYTQAKEIMTFLLGPATVALAVPLYKNRSIIIQNIVPAGIGLIIGSLSTTIAAVLLVKCFRLPQLIAASISTKSITVPVAIEVSKMIDGDPTLAAAFVVATGITGTMMGSWLMNKTNIQHPLARGLAFGTIVHGQGTAEAVREGELQGAIAGVAMGITAIFTSLFIPFLLPFLV